MPGNYVADVVNQALAAIGSEAAIGDLEEGTREAKVALRAYPQCLRQLLRAAHWDFARKMVPLVLLGDASGQTAGVGTLVQAPWLYCYAYPIDCMKIRFVPWNGTATPPTVPGNISVSPVPASPILSAPPLPSVRLTPAPFVLGTDANYPPPDGTPTNNVQGISPNGRTVVLTNVKFAQAVYTSLVLYPSVWDAQFRAAMVAYLASEMALPLSDDKKFGLALRGQQIAIAKSRLSEARATNGNEAGWPQSTDMSPVDWLQIRNIGGGSWGYGVNGYGSCSGAVGTYAGWDGCGFGDGSVY